MARIRSIHPLDWPQHYEWSGKWRHVYVVAEHDGPVKIGCARNAFLRLSELQVGNPRNLTLYAVYRCEDRSTGHHYEKMAHVHFASRRIRGEWFDVRPAEVVAFFGGNRSKGDKLPGEWRQ